MLPPRVTPGWPGENGQREAGGPPRSHALAIAAILSLGLAGSLHAQSLPGCGNGIRDAGEQCDDSNPDNLDGCSSQCKFEQIQRINQLKMQFATSGSCAQNALGNAIGSIARSNLQTVIDAAVHDGSTSVIFAMLGLDDLSGTADPSVQVGIVNGAPVAGAGYDGTNDLDWWYAIDPASLDDARVPISQLSGSIASGVLTAGPGSATLNLSPGESPFAWHVSSLRLSATSGSSSTPLTSSGSAPPGHVASEHLDPLLTSYASSGGGITGELCGNVSASSLAAGPLPASLRVGGSIACVEGYTLANSWLDLLVGGCHVLGGFITAISRTQPDQEDPGVPPAGAGPPYTLSATGGNHVVDTCKDKNAQVVNLSACLNDAAYSSFFKFSTDRVIAVCSRPDAPVASNDGPICAGQTLQLTASTVAGATYAWTGPNGFTSSQQNPSIPAATTATSGTYSVTVTVGGCTSAAATTDVSVLACSAQPMALVVDSAGNGVLEPGESVVVAPSWKNPTGSDFPLSGTGTGFAGPAGATYSISDATAAYGTITAGATSNCTSATGDCYTVFVSSPATRPQLHWDASFSESVSSGDAKSWVVHVGGSFADAPAGSGFYRFIETMLHDAITAGCGGGNYCPGSSVTRAQMAVFLLKGEHGAAYAPPAATGTVFGDVPASSFAAAWIERLAAEAITGGCGGGNYCPGSSVTRAQMAVFLLRAEHGPAYVPPAATGTVFADVPASSFAAAWIEQLFAEGVTGGCGGGNYCPGNSVTRGQMSVFLSKTFGLVLYGP